MVSSWGVRDGSERMSSIASSSACLVAWVRYKMILFAKEVAEN